VLLGCAATLAGCGALPEDHAATDLLARSGSGLRKTLRGTPGFLADQERGLVRIGQRLASLPAAAQARTVKLGNTLVRGSEGQGDALARLLPRASHGFGLAAERELQGTRRLAARADQVADRFGRDATSLQRNTADLPRHIHLARDILPMPTDRERTVDLEPAARRRTLLERILDRMSL
jgi:hypothetical protein